METYELYHCGVHSLFLAYGSLEEAANAKDELEKLYGNGNVQIKQTVSQTTIDHVRNVKRCIAEFEKHYGPLDQEDEDDLVPFTDEQLKHLREANLCYDDDDWPEGE